MRADGNNDSPSQVKASCKATYHADKHSGTRQTSHIRLIVLHSTEGGTAKEIAKYFASAASEGSAHLVVDDHECYRCLRNEEIPWAAPGANSQGFHIEQCGYAAWSKASWMQHEDTLDRAAYKTALHCHYFDIPPQFLDAKHVAAGKPGITTHAEVSKAFPNNQGNHHDPGTGWPREYFMALVKRHYADLDASNL